MQTYPYFTDAVLFSETMRLACLRQFLQILKEASPLYPGTVLVIHKASKCHWNALDFYAQFMAYELLLKY